MKIDKKAKKNISTLIKGICGTTIHYDISNDRYVSQDEYDGDCDMPTEDTWEYANILLKNIGIKQTNIEEIPLCWNNCVSICFCISKISFSLHAKIENNKVWLQICIDNDCFQRNSLQIEDDEKGSNMGACLFEIEF